MNKAEAHRTFMSQLAQSGETADEGLLFNYRLAGNLDLIRELFFQLYPEPKHTKYFQRLMTLLPELHGSRPANLRKQDSSRLQSGNWYQSQEIIGMQLYPELFNKDLPGLKKKLSYFEELGVNLLHIMPVTTRPKGPNDGGYAVNSYTAVDPKYGTDADLLALTADMREKEILLMLDFVVNHTSDEFPWARKAAAGSKKYQEYYYTYPDRKIPDAFEKVLPEVFPTTAPGNFTWNEKMNRWVMTVFNSYQWDLNYTNPEVFLEMFKQLVSLVNLGVDIVRFDALAFLWKRIGTISQNLPEAHIVTSLFRMCLQVVAPGVIFLAEAIVGPRDIIKYFGEGSLEGNECELAYNASFMALLWNSIATTKTNLLYKNLHGIPDKPAEASWINYIRCHDDIGLSFEDQYIYEMGWEPSLHRKFLLEYYTQKLDWSPAMGLPFMYNPKTGDGRIAGTAASLLGLEKAILNRDPSAIEQAVDKIVMMHGVILAYNGIPMIFSGDELGTLNDYSYEEDRNKMMDSRWVNRPQLDWEMVESLKGSRSPHAKVYRQIQKLIAIRKKRSVFADSGNLKLHDPRGDHLFIFERGGKEKGSVLILANFNTQPNAVRHSTLSQLGYTNGKQVRDLISSKAIQVKKGLLQMKPYELFWLVKP